NLQAEGAAKMAPATEPPEAWRTDAELEWISSRGECRQLMAWFGELATAPGRRRATKVYDGDHTCQLPRFAAFTGLPGVACQPCDEPAQFVYDPDPGVLAAGLLGALADRYQLTSLGPGGAYLTGDALIIDPFLTPMRVEDCLPLRVVEISRLLSA